MDQPDPLVDEVIRLRDELTLLAGSMAAFRFDTTRLLQDMAIQQTAGLEFSVFGLRIHVKPRGLVDKK